MKSSFENKNISKENTGKDDPRSTFLSPLHSYKNSSDLLESLAPKVQMTSARNSKLTCMLGKYNIFMHGTYAYQATYYTVLQSDDSSMRCQTLCLRSYLPHYIPLLYFAYKILSLPFYFSTCPSLFYLSLFTFSSPTSCPFSFFLSPFPPSSYPFSSPAFSMPTLHALSP